MSKNVIISTSTRTPIGSFNGVLSTVPAPKLGADTIRSIIQKSGVDPNRVNEVIMGNVLTAGLGQAPARQAAIYGCLHNSVEALTINKMCGSGLKAIMLAQQSILAGDAEVVIAGGMENMSRSPHIIPASRSGIRMGHGKVLDTMIVDGLWDAYGDKHMGGCAETCAGDYNFSREEQDEFAITSYKKSQNAQENGLFENEITPVTIKDKKGNESVIRNDEEPGRVNFEKIPYLRPVFDKNGTVTAANASTINDGAAAVLVTTEEFAKSQNLPFQARIVAQASAAQEPEWFTTAPVKAINKVLKRAGLSIKDIDLFEINEAFSVVVLAAIRDLQLDPEKVNIYGGAVSLGHPIGASGARIVCTLLNAMEQQKLNYGLAAICIGGGEASAVIFERIE